MDFQRDKELDGRFARGNKLGRRFQPGGKPGPGNPWAAHVEKFRSALFRCLKPSDFKAIARKLIESAKAGEPWAIREVLDRAIGRTTQMVEVASTTPTNDNRVQVMAIFDDPALLATANELAKRIEHQQAENNDA